MNFRHYIKCIIFGQGHVGSGGYAKSTRDNTPNLEHVHTFIASFAERKQENEEETHMDTDRRSLT